MDCFITDYGVPKENAAALEDSIMQKGKPVTAGSRILEGFSAPIDATVVSRMSENGVNIAGRTAMDEFGIGGISGDRPDDISGAVRAVAEGIVPFALCNDVFGKQRRQTAENGVCYIHPTYGTVSRYGLIPLASSMDQIGIACKSLPEGFRLLSIIAGHDPKDGAMFPEEHYNYEKKDKKIRVSIPRDIADKADEGTRQAMLELAGRFDAADMELEHFQVYKQTLYILACAEISNNISRYDGIKFGYRASNYKGVNDLYVRTRTEGFGPDTKLAAVMGSMVLSRDQYIPYYEKAMKIRRLIKNSLRFGEYDVILLPAKISGDPYENLSLFALAPLAGLPSISFSWRGHGVQMIADVKDESALLTAWEVLQS